MEIEKSSISFFEQYLKEAPDETPPDVAAVQGDTGGGGNDTTPDVPEDAGDTDAGPPDIPDDPGADGGTDDGAPPDLDDGFGDEGIDDGTGNEEDNPEEDNNQNSNLGLDDKVSAVMNQRLYQRYLNLLTEINNQLMMIKNNNDIVYTLSKDTLDTVSALKRLDENIRLYIKNSFLNENYSKNLLFFNKCLNLLKLLNDSFGDSIRKGIKEL